MGGGQPSCWVVPAALRYWCMPGTSKLSKPLSTTTVLPERTKGIGIQLGYSIGRVAAGLYPMPAPFLYRWAS